MADDKSKTTQKTTSSTSKTADSGAKDEPTTETEVKQASATGGIKNTGPVMAGPTQDDLNPAYAPPKEDEESKDEK